VVTMHTESDFSFAFWFSLPVGEDGDGGAFNEYLLQRPKRRRVGKILFHVYDDDGRFLRYCCRSVIVEQVGRASVG